MPESDEVLSHQIAQFDLLHLEMVRINNKLVIIIIILLVFLGMLIVPWLFMPMYNLVNVIK